MNLIELFNRPPERRAAFLDEHCAGDPELRRQVEGLLQAHDRAGEFLVGPTVRPTALEHAPEPSATLIGPYKLLEVIGEGGFGTVYMAEQEHSPTGAWQRSSRYAQTNEQSRLVPAQPWPIE